MKNSIVIAFIGFLFLSLNVLTINAQELTDSEVKIKNKGNIVRVVNKSKPVRKALEAWYEQNTEAFKQKDVAAVMALRTDDFHTVLPNGTKNTRADMQAYTERFLGMIDHFISLDFQIGTIDVQGEFASADVTQKTVRMQRLSDGQLHKVEAGAVQRETWKKTAEGWKLYRVDNIRDSGIFIDGNLFRPPQ